MSNELLTIPVDRIRIVAGHNVRRQVGDLAELAESIRSVGVLQPLTVRVSEEQGVGEDRSYELIAGERRLTAARKAGLEEVPCNVVTLEEVDRIVAMLAENLQRVDIDPMEEAAGFQRLTELGLTQRQVAAKLGKSQAHVSKRLSLLRLPDEVKAQVDTGSLPVGEALHLTRLADHPDQLKTALREARQGYGGGGVEGAVKRQVRKMEEERKRTKVCADLEARGITVIAPDQYGHKPNLYPQVGVSWELNIPVATHEKLPCHAAFVRATGELEWICTDPKSHLAEGKEAMPEHLRRTLDAQKTRSETIEQNRRIRQARERRRAAIRDLLANPKKGETEQFMLRSLLAVCSHVGHGIPAVAADLLGRKGVASYQAGELLEQIAAPNPDALYRACLALGLAVGEAAMERADFYSGSPEILRLLDFLKALGFQEDWQEKEARKSAQRMVAERKRRGVAVGSEEGCVECGQAGPMPAATTDMPEYRLYVESGAQDEGVCFECWKRLEDVRTCRGCACTDLEGCDGGCEWVEDDLCSACAAQSGAEGSASRLEATA